MRIRIKKENIFYQADDCIRTLSTLYQIYVYPYYYNMIKNQLGKVDPFWVRETPTYLVDYREIKKEMKLFSNNGLILFGFKLNHGNNPSGFYPSNRIYFLKNADLNSKLQNSNWKNLNLSSPDLIDWRTVIQNGVNIVRGIKI